MYRHTGLSSLHVVYCEEDMYSLLVNAKLHFITTVVNLTYVTGTFFAPVGENCNTIKSKLCF